MLLGSPRQFHGNFHVPRNDLQGNSPLQLPFQMQLRGVWGTKSRLGASCGDLNLLGAILWDTQLAWVNPLGKFDATLGKLKLLEGIPLGNSMGLGISPKITQNCLNIPFGNHEAVLWETRGDPFRHSKQSIWDTLFNWGTWSGWASSIEAIPWGTFLFF